MNSHTRAIYSLRLGLYVEDEQFWGGLFRRRPGSEENLGALRVGNIPDLGWETIMTRERRQNHRVPSQQVVSLVLPNTNENECTAVAKNVSVDGAFLVCDRRITPGSRLDASLILPAEVTLTESKRVCCEIKVLRVIEELPDGNFLTAVEFEQYRLP